MGRLPQHGRSTRQQQVFRKRAPHHHTGISLAHISRTAGNRPPPPRRRIATASSGPPAPRPGDLSLPSLLRLASTRRGPPASSSEPSSRHGASQTRRARALPGAPLPRAIIRRPRWTPRAPSFWPRAAQFWPRQPRASHPRRPMPTPDTHPRTTAAPSRGTAPPRPPAVRVRHGLRLAACHHSRAWRAGSCSVSKSRIGRPLTLRMTPARGVQDPLSALAFTANGLKRPVQLARRHELYLLACSNRALGCTAGHIIPHQQRCLAMHG